VRSSRPPVPPCPRSATCPGRSRWFPRLPRQASGSWRRPRAPVDTWSDDALWAAGRTGRADALHVLVDRYRGMLLRVTERSLARGLGRMAGEPEAAVTADDVIGQVVGHLWGARATLPPTADPSRFLRALAINIARNTARAAVRYTSRVHPDWAAVLSVAAPMRRDPGERLERKERTEALARAINDLPALQRRVAIDVLCNEATTAQTAVAIGISERGVEKARAKLLRRLRSALSHLAQGRGGGGPEPRVDIST
jgi:RNA polymerase sigma factor (sigma-70 family)